MADTIYYIDDKQPLDTTNVPAVICKTLDILNCHIESCYKTDTAVLIENDITVITNCDGIYFSNKITLPEFKKIRQNNPNLSIGINCELSKHDGISYGEAGADFIVFKGNGDELNEIVNWWQEMMEIPVVVQGRVNSQTLADFIIVAPNS